MLFKIKPLEWEEVPGNCWVARPALGYVWVRRNEQCRSWDIVQDGHLVHVVELDAAKRWAEEDYIKRLSGSLTLATRAEDVPAHEIDDWKWVDHKIRNVWSGYDPNAHHYGNLHVLVAHAEGYERYIATYRCEDKQGEIARQQVEIERLSRELAEVTRSRMVVCEQCGNKRCPHAQDAGFVCTGSNEPNQVGVRGI